MNVYYPPAQPLDFLTKIFFNLAEMIADTVIVGGDFNCILNPLIDFLIVLLLLKTRVLCAICEDLRSDNV